VSEPQVELLLRGAASQRLKRRAIATVALILALFAWLVNVALVRVGARSCDWMTREELLIATLAPALGVVSSLVLLLSARTSARLVAQGIHWSGLVLAAVGLLDEPGLAPIATPALALGCGVALFVLEELGLEPERFLPPLDRAPIRAAYGAAVTVTVAQVLALADVALANRLRNGLGAFDMVGVAAIAGLGVALLSLARLRVGAWKVAAVANGAVALLALAGRLWVPATMRHVLIIGALTQALLAVYLGRRARTADGEADAEIAAHAGAVARGAALLVAIALVAWSVWGVTPAAIARGCLD
jgi:hypothetical protein